MVHPQQQPAGVFIRRVEAANLDDEVATIRFLLPSYPYITIKFDYPGNVAARRERRRGRGAAAVGEDEHELPAVERYRLTKANVDNLHPLLLGITLCNNNGRLPVIDGPFGRVKSAWQVIFSDFDLRSDKHVRSSVDFLQASGVDFDYLRQRGVPAAAFARALIDHGVVSDESRGRITWVTFGGLHDFGFLLKILTGEPLPETGEAFTARLTEHLGNVYDAKYVAAQLPVAAYLRGGLVTVARIMAAPAAAVAEPRRAGEKSLVACEVFMRLTGLFFAFHSVAVHAGKIDGLQWHVRRR